MPLSPARPGRDRVGGRLCPLVWRATRFEATARARQPVRSSGDGSRRFGKRLILDRARKDADDRAEEAKADDRDGVAAEVAGVRSDEGRRGRDGRDDSLRVDRLDDHVRGDRARHRGLGRRCVSEGRHTEAKVGQRQENG